MAGVKIFQESFKYLTEIVKKTTSSINEDTLRKIFLILSGARRLNRNVIVDGQGRSKQSILLVEDCLEHNGFDIIYPTSNANLRPWKKGDIFIINSGSGGGSTLKHALAAKEDGLIVTGMSYNSDLLKYFPDMLILEKMKKSEDESRLSSQLAPLGTEFELSSAVIGSCLAYSLEDDVEVALNKFKSSINNVINLFDKTYSYLEGELESLLSFISLISRYIPQENKHNIYFRGVGRDAIINRVAAIRYGHMFKLDDKKNIEKDLHVIYEGHWDLRKSGDLAIITSGSGETSQTLNYATQAFISGLRIFGITSFEDSDLGRFCGRVDGRLVIPGRNESHSGYNQPSDKREHYLPAFELNCYITLDALLAQIAVDHNITEDDMRSSHRAKVLE